MGNLYLSAILIIGLVFIATGLLLNIYAIKKNKKIMAIGFVSNVIGALFCVYCFTLFFTGYTKGLRTMHISVADVQHHLTYTPTSDISVASLSESELKGRIIIFYKFDCPDCHAIYNELQHKTQNNDKIHWVSVSSRTGKQLLEKYPVEHVPSGIYIRNNDFGDEINYTHKILYSQNQQGETILHLESLERLLYLQSQNR